MNILIIGSKYTQIPDSHGRAIEGLVQKYLDYNSREHKNYITTYSIYDEESSNYSKLSNTEYRFINKKSPIYRFNHILFGILKKIFTNRIGDEFAIEVIKDLRRKHENNKYEKIIILNNISNMDYFCRKLNGKKILYLHNDYFNADVPNSKRIYNNLDEVWCVSKYIKSRVAEIDRSIDKTVLLYNGIDFKEFDSNFSKKDCEIIKKQYGIQTKDFIVTFVGRTIKEKGVEELIKAFLNFSSNKDNVKLFIVGSPNDISKEYQDFYNKLINNYGKKYNNLYFLGKLDHNEIAKIYSFTNVQVIPSMCNEAFGLTVIESMYSKVPLIVSNTGAIPELVANDCAIITEKEDIIKNIINELNNFYSSKIDIKKMTENAKKRALQFSESNYVNNFDNLINQ